MDPQALEDWLVAASAPPSLNSQSQKHAPGPVPAARQVAEVRFHLWRPVISQLSDVAARLLSDCIFGIYFSDFNGCTCASFGSIVYINAGCINLKSCCVKLEF